ncbi:hypothetical protein ACFL31_00975 [Candidatus Margulisiibacteriota bacterium]
MSRRLCLFVFFLLLASAASAIDFAEAYRIRLENVVGGTIEVSADGGATWQAVGQVLYPTEKVSERGYAAAKWVGEGRVAASAVNAIHIKTGPKDWDRTIFSILPKEFLQPPKVYKSFLSPNSSIYTDIPAGTSIFGGGFSPYVGNMVMLSAPAQPVTPLPRDYVPKIDDVLYVIVDRPVKYPREIVFENRFGGQITVKYFSGEPKKVIGEVKRPVVGIGRFPGSRYAAPGRIRANHAGVIDISTSPIGSVGGFQIVPAAHGEDMGYVREATQWMVIGAASVEDPSLEGLAPFYKYFIQPNYRLSDLEDEDWYNRLLQRFLVEVKYVGDDAWYPMPVHEINDFYLRRNIPRWANSALRGISHFRVLFPIEESGIL